MTKNGLYFKLKDDKHVFGNVYSDNIKITEKCIFFNVAGETKRIYKDDCIFWAIVPNITLAEHEKLKKKHEALLSENGLLLENGKILQYINGQFIIDNEEFIIGEEAYCIITGRELIYS